MATFKERMRKILDTKDIQDNYIGKIPSDIRDAFFDNIYTNQQRLLNDFLMQELFGENLAEEVYWFMFDWKPGNIIHCIEKDYTINTLDDFCAFIKEQYGID